MNILRTLASSVILALALSQPIFAAGSIAGRVVDDDGAPLAQATVRAYDRLGELIAEDATEAGAFEIGPLPAGRYYLVAESGLDRILYPDLPCDDFECETPFGQPFTLDENEVITGVDIVLPRRLTAHFVARDAQSHEPLELVHWHLTNADTGRQLIDDVGELVTELMPGRYFVDARKSGYQHEGFGGVALRNTGTDELERSTAVVIAKNQTNIFVLDLDKAGAISGKVFGPATLPPGCELLLFPLGREQKLSNALRLPCEFDQDFLVDVPTGQYRLLVSGGRFAGTPFYGVLPGGIYCVFDFVDHFCDLDRGAVVDVAQGQTTAVGDFQMPAFGSVQGQIDLPADETGLLAVYDQRGKLVWSEEHGPGPYELFLPPGSYFLELRGEPPVGRQLWDSLPCTPAACDPATGTAIAVAAFHSTLGIDFHPPAALPLACGTLDGCLTDDRFRITGRWTDFEGQQGDAHILIHEVEDTAFYYFFAPNNVELMVKVLNACYPPYNRFWVFASGTTNVGVDLQVQDTVTGAIKSYHNNVGQNFVPVLDTDAFTCGGGTPLAAGGAALQSSLATAPEVATAAAPAVAGVPDFCDPLNAICQDFSHFRVDAVWQTAVATGKGIPDSAATGSFYFFSPENLELQVKVLDGCHINGNYWIFAAGLTNVGVDLTITDTHTRRQRTYHNANQHPFEPILDTTAMACWR